MKASLVMLLILFLTPMLYATESMILEPPAEIMEDENLVMKIPEGEWTIIIPENGVLAFSPAGWKALSQWVMADHVRSCESAIVEALKGQMTQIDRLKRQRRFLIAATGVLAIIGGIVIVLK